MHRRHEAAVLGEERTAPKTPRENSPASQANVAPEAGMRRRWSRASCYPCGVHAQRRRGEGFLRRQPCRRLQPADAGGSSGRFRRQLHQHWMRGGFERRLSVGAAGDERRRGEYGEGDVLVISALEKLEDHPKNSHKSF